MGIVKLENSTKTDIQLASYSRAIIKLFIESSLRSQKKIRKQLKMRKVHGFVVDTLFVPRSDRRDWLYFTIF